MTELIVPLVGMHFRPPSKHVLAALPAGCQLRLEAEPSNPYDPKAIRVFARSVDIPESQYGALAEALLGTGFDLDDVLAGGIDPSASGEVPAGEIWLGYIADSDGKLCKKNELAGNREVAVFAHEHTKSHFALGGEDVPEFDGIAASLVFMGDGAPGVRVASQVR